MGYCSRVRVFVLIVWLIVGNFSSAEARTGQPFALASFAGLEAMRNSLGMISNSAVIKGKFRASALKVFDNTFGATDVGLDLLVQMSALEVPELRARAEYNIHQILGVLARIPRHGSGLFFRWYRPSEGGSWASVSDDDVSSIDNLHLALALWTASQRLVKKLPGLSAQARCLYSAFDFTPFFDVERKLIGGNLRRKNGSWELEGYRYHLGSEARSLYFLGYALRLFKNVKDVDLLSSIAIAPLESIDKEGTALFKVWDGALFQLFLPALLIDEQRYHPGWRAAHVKVWRQLMNGKEQPCLPPAMSSATLVGVSFSSDTEEPLSLSYTGKAGHAWLKETSNPDEVFENLFVPHAALLAGLENQEEALALLAQVEKCFSSHLVPAFLPQYGFVSAVRLELNSGVTVPGAVGVDKTIEALSLFTYLSSDRVSPCAAALQGNRSARLRLEEAYRNLSARL